MTSNNPPSTLHRLPSRAAGEEIYPPVQTPKPEMRSSLSIVMQDNRSVLYGTPEKTADALGRTYRLLQKSSRRDLDEASHIQEEEELMCSDKESIVSVCGSEKASSFESRTSMKKDYPPLLPRKGYSFDSTLRQRGQIHLQSADLFENFSPVQKERQLWEPTLPDVFSLGTIELIPTDAPELVQKNEEELKTLHPNTFGKPCLEVQPFRGNTGFQLAIS